VCLVQEAHQPHALGRAVAAHELIAEPLPGQRAALQALQRGMQRTGQTERRRHLESSLDRRARLQLLLRRPLRPLRLRLPLRQLRPPTLLPPQPLRQPLLLTLPPLPRQLPKRSRLTPPLLQRMQPRSNASCYEKSRHPPAFLCAAIC